MQLATRLAISLIFLTLSAIFSYDFLLNTSLSISPRDGFTAQAVNDFESNGNTKSILRATDSSWILDYEIRPGAPYPFASLILSPPAELAFLDLSQFDRIQVRIKAEGAQGNTRIHLRNINPAYTVAEQLISLKYNEVQFDPRTTPYPAKFLWADFHVPAWWISMLKVPYWHARTEVNHVSRIEITTPENTPLWTTGSIEFVSMEFQGKQISSTLFYQILLSIWVLVGLVGLAFRAIGYRRSLHTKELREKELLTINEALSIKSQEMETMAKRDALTGVLNRNGLREHLAAALEAGRTKGEPLSVIMCDIDFFKKVNDTQGHARGDEILKEVSQVFTKNTRLLDRVARWGGEEFLILAPQTNLQTAVFAAEKLRKLIAESPSKVTCSFGVAEWRPGENLAELIHRADKALYRSKENGRNQVQSNWN